MIGLMLNDRYRLDAELGRGGMGVVYQARDLLLDRDVAAKVLSAASLGTEGRARLLREARSAAQLNHPNIVSVHDAGEATVAGVRDPVPFIVMELVAGPSLRARPPGTLEEGLRLASQICVALEHAHSHGIVHRDLKPENVLLAPGEAVPAGGQGGTAKLNDFGLASSMASRLTTEGTIVGTVFYLAPELALGQEYDGRADLYALGVMMYEWATGELPFTADDPLAVVSQHLHAPPVPPRARSAAIPAAVDALIMRLLSKHAEDRPRKAADVADVLERLVAGEALPAEFAAEEQELTMLDRIARGRLVAREKELAHVRALWQRAVAGEGHVLLISGEPGVGKSRLVRELITQVQVGGDRALVGECYAEGGAPYAPFGQIIRRGLENGNGDGLALPDFVLADLVALAPALRLTFPGVPPNPVLDPQSEQQRLFESVASLCTALSARRPLLLVLEDGHWADSGSLALLRHLARRTRRQPVLIVVTYREVELDETRPFRDVLVDLNRERLATRLKLSRLDREETRRLLAALFAEAITPAFLDGIYRETEGNPFFVEEVSKALVQSGSLTFAGGRWHRPSMEQLDVPQSVRLAIQARVGRLPGEVQQILQMAAILGREFSVDLLVEAMGSAGMDEEAVIEGLETAARAQLVEEVSAARDVHFAFVHALTAATLADEVPTLRRRRLHRYAADAVERLHPADDEALAHHYAAAGDDERALTYSMRAGDRAAAAYANAEAERHYRAALELAADGVARAGLLAKLGIAQAAQSRFEDALASWRKGIELFSAARDRDGVACLYAYSGRATWDKGDTAEGLALCRQGMAATVETGVEPPQGAGMARLLHETARACYFNGLSEEAVPLGQQALALAERLGAVELQAEALVTLALLPGSTPRGAVALLERAVKLAEAAGLLPQAARAENNLGAIYFYDLAELECARAHFLKSAELSHQVGALAQEIFSGANAAGAALYQGMLTTAEQELQALRLKEAALPDPGGVAYSLSGPEAFLLRFRGQLAEAVGPLQALRAKEAAAGDLEALANVTDCLADLQAEAGEEAQSEAAALEAIQAFQKVHGQSIMPTASLSVRYARRGELERARSLLSRAREEASGAYATVWGPGLVSRAEAHLAAAEGRWPAALAAFERATGEARRLGTPWFAARFEREWAEALLARAEPGDREQAIVLLGQAAAGFEAIGAPFYAEQARRRVDDLARLP